MKMANYITGTQSFTFTEMNTLKINYLKSELRVNEYTAKYSKLYSSQMKIWPQVTPLYFVT